MNTSQKNTSKQASLDTSFIDKLLEFFTGKNNEERLKEKQLKNIFTEQEMDIPGQQAASEQ